MYYLGFDIGGSSVKAVLVKERKVIKSKIEELPKSLKAFLKLIEKITNELTKDIPAKEIAGIGIGVAGTLDLKREKMLNSPNIPYLNNKPLKKLFQKKLKYPVKLENDVNCFLLAESKIGLAQNLKNIFYLTLGSGIGGALMINGQLILGAHGAAGEAGHMIIEPNKKLDLEELASNKFIKRILKIGSVEAERRARTGDKKAKEAFKKLGKNLGVGIANIINIFDPEAVILAGGVSLAKKFILSDIKKEIKKYVTSPAARKTKILFSKLGRFGGAIGATFLLGRHYHS